MHVNKPGKTTTKQVMSFKDGELARKEIKKTQLTELVKLLLR